MAAASSLVKKIEKDFLACAICFEQLRDPIGLPCLHGFCFECLDNWHKTSKDTSHLICPACKEPALLPKGGIKGFPGHFLVKNLRETIDMEKKKPSPLQKPSPPGLSVGDRVRVKATIALPYGLSHKSIGTIRSIHGTACKIDFPRHKGWAALDRLKLVKPCDVCGKNGSAVYYCLDCSDNLCDSCHDSHKAFRFMRDHKIAPVEDVESGKVTREGRFCKIHGERVRYYCETEQKQVCPDCVSLKTCPMEHERITMKEAAKKQATSIDELIQKCKATDVKIQDAVRQTKMVKQDLTKAENEAQAVLEQVKKDCNSQIDALTKTHKEKINQLVEDRSKEIQATLDKLQINLTQIQKACATGSELTQSGSEFEITHQYVDTMKLLEDLSQTQSNVAAVRKELSYLKFEVSTPEISSIGQLHT